MNILDIIQRQPHPRPWEEGEKIPWNDLEFSKRMLNEHLSQAHDAASRRIEKIDQHVRWIHHVLLKETVTKILDLGCGPGLYVHRLAKLGHNCVGIDYSPASIAYAKEQANHEQLPCLYKDEDIRIADYGDGFGLVMSIFGEFNVFKPTDIHRILNKAHAALLPGGFLLIEPHTFDAIKNIGHEPKTWDSAQTGLFSAAPHVYFQENIWDDDARVAIIRHYIIDAETGRVACHSSSTQAYTNQEYRTLLSECGFINPVFYSSLGGKEGEPEGVLLGIVAEKSVS